MVKRSNQGKVGKEEGEEMKAAVYCRVSTEDQEREGTSLQSQREACLKKAQELGYEVPEEFTAIETYSGLSLDRPKLNEVRQWVRDKEVDVVIAYTLDRLSRDPVHFIILQEELERSGVELTLVTETVDSSDIGKLIAHIKGFAAKLEAEKIKERTMRGKRERVKSGRLPGGRFTKLYGYDYVKGKGPGEGIRYTNENESKVVKEIYRLYTEEGMSLCKITQRLNELQIPSPSGKNSWNRTGVHYVLTNPAYTGRTFLFTRHKVEAKRHLKARRTNQFTHVVMRPREEWVELKGATPAIVSTDLFNLVQSRLRRNKELASRNTRRRYLLSGYIFCANCGRRYTARNRGRNAYYSCPKCRNRNLNADYLDPSIWVKVEEVLSNPEMVFAGIEMLRNEVSNEEQYRKELEGVDLELCHMTREKDRLWNAYKITGDEAKFTSEIKDIMSKIDELERHKIELVKKDELAEQAETNIDSIRECCELVRHNLGSLSFFDKRQALEALGIRVIAGKEILKLEGTMPIVSSQCA